MPEASKMKLRESQCYRAERIDVVQWGSTTLHIQVYTQWGMSHLFCPSAGGEAACFRTLSSAFPLLLLFKLCFDPDALTLPLTASAPLIVVADMFEYETCIEGN